MIYQMYLFACLFLLICMLSLIDLKLSRKYDKDIFCLLLLIYLACRYGYGNDYFSYMDIFYSIKYTGYDQITTINDRMELGWLVLNAVFPGSSFNLFVVFLSCIQVSAVYFLFHKSELSKYILVSSFIYIFSPLNMLTLLSAMRQSVALTLFVFSLIFVIRKNLLFFSMTLIFAALFHSSVIILFPIYFMYNNISRINIKFISAITFIIIIGTLSFSEAMNAYFNIFIAAFSVLGKYSMYDEAGALGSGGAIFFYGVLVIILSYCYNLEEGYRKLFILLSIVGFIVSILTPSLIILYRVSLYFSIFSMVSIPVAAQVIRRTELRYSFIFIYILFIAYIYVETASTENWKDGFEFYKTYL